MAKTLYLIHIQYKIITHRFCPYTRYWSICKQQWFGQVLECLNMKGAISTLESTVINNNWNHAVEGGGY